jgi:hypothetical protein
MRFIPLWGGFMCCHAVCKLGKSWPMQGLAFGVLDATGVTLSLWWNGHLDG